MNSDGPKRLAPALIAVGGFAGTGKTAVSRRLAADLGLPRLGSDTIGRTIRNSGGIKQGQVDAYWIAYELLFRLGEEFIQSGVSVILDLTMGWAFQWEQVDDMIRRSPQALLLPIILRCPHERCIERIRRRHRSNPCYYDPPEHYLAEPKIRRTREFLASLDRPDVRFVDADRPPDEVYEEVKAYIWKAVTAAGHPLAVSPG